MGLSAATWANIADIIGAFSIITGFKLGWIQIRHLRQQQRDAVAINLEQTFYNQDLSEAKAMIARLPPGPMSLAMAVRSSNIRNIASFMARQGSIDQCVWQSLTD